MPTTQGDGVGVRGHSIQISSTQHWRDSLAVCHVWSLAAQVDDRPFAIAPTAPICPRCGTTLLTLVEREGRLDRHLGAEVGSVFDFVRSLS